MMQRRLSFGLIVATLLPVPLAAQELPLDSLLRAHRHVITLGDAGLSGPGAELLVDAASAAQFVGVLEEHNVAALADFSAALFERLHQEHGFDYLAVEQGSVITRWLNEAPRRGDLGAMARMVASFPHALSFATDEELEMMARAARASDASTTPVWGVDQEFGALHILDRLHTLAPSRDARSTVSALIDVARRYETSRSGDTLYLSQVAMPADFAALPDLFAEAGTEAARLIEALRRTNRIYHNWYRAAVLDEPTAYENMREREHSMKLRFMERYREAQKAGDSLPRVVAKLGHWHLFRGIYRGNVPTFGNFLSEFAISNGLGSFLISTYVVGSPEGWRNTGGPLAAAAGEGTFTLIDLRPLRPLAHQGRIADLSEGLERLLFRADAALIVRGGRTGGYRFASGESPPDG